MPPRGQAGLWRLARRAGCGLWGKQTGNATGCEGRLAASLQKKKIMKKMLGLTGDCEPQNRQAWLPTPGALWVGSRGLAGISQSPERCPSAGASAAPSCRFHRAHGKIRPPESLVLCQICWAASSKETGRMAEADGLDVPCLLPWEA